MEAANVLPARRTRRKQLHVWITEREYGRLQQLADAGGESLSVIVRRALRMVGSTSNPTDQAAHVENQ